jgi:predicted glycosyltransferase
MRYLFFTNTPAHVHLYRHVVEELRASGHETLVLARDYGCTLDLLEWYDLPHEVYGACETTKGSLFLRLPGHYYRIVQETISFDPDLIFGMGGYAAPAGAITGTPTALVLDSEPTTLDHAISRPFASVILTPEAFRKDLGRKHHTFPGFKESAYLHPAVHEPREDIRERLGVGSDEPYAMVRFNAFGSHHDVGHDGFDPDERRALVEALSEHATVLVSDEGDELDLSSLPARPFDLHPALVHDALAEAALLVADTQTMVTEAALLGTPAIRSNSFVGGSDMGNFIALEEAGLVENLREFDAVVERATGILEDPEARAAWRRKRESFVEGMVNLTDLLVAVATEYEAFDEIPELSRRGGGSGSATGAPYQLPESQ